MASRTIIAFVRLVTPFLFAVPVLALFLGACASTSTREAGDSIKKVTAPQHASISRRKRNIARSFDTSPEPEHFSICFGPVCEHTADISLSQAEWDRIRAALEPDKFLTAEVERERMGTAIGMLEVAVTRDAEDAARKGNWSLRHKDCIDEATNTTVYLTMMQNDGLLRWHKVGSPVSRGFFTLLPSLPHTSAVIHEVVGDSDYAVDSFYRPNGQPPYIVPLAKWKRGWTPAKTRRSLSGVN